jgi:hypothetical protein
VVAGEEISVPVKQNHMAPCVAGRWDCQKFVIDRDGVFAVEDLLNAEPGCAITSVHDPDGPELLCKSVVIGDVITVRQKYPANAAQLTDSPDEVACKAWRID